MKQRSILVLRFPCMTRSKDESLFVCVRRTGWGEGRMKEFASLNKSFSIFVVWYLNVLLVGSRIRPSGPIIKFANIFLRPGKLSSITRQ